MPGEELSDALRAAGELRQNGINAILTHLGENISERQEAERVSDIAAEVKRATDDQVQTGAGIAQAMEQIASDVRVIRDRLGRQLAEAEQIASATRATLTIAKKNNAIAEQFSAAIEDLVVSGKVFSEDVSRFRV